MKVRVPKSNDPREIKKAIQQLNTQLGPTSEPTFSNIELTDLTATRLVQSDSDKTLSSVADLTAWVAGTTNEVNVVDDGDGTITIGIVNPLIVAKGGTGLATLTDHSILLGSGTDAMTPLGAATNGQLPIGSTGADPSLAGLTGTTNQITITNGAGSITLSTPQDIHTGASPTFAGLAINGQSTMKDDTFPVLDLIRTSSVTNLVRTAFRFVHKTSGDMADGFGGGMVFAIEDNSQIVTNVAQIRALRDGGDNSGKIEIGTYEFGTFTSCIDIFANNDVDIPADFTAGTIQADNGFTGTGAYTNFNIVGGIVISAS